MCKNVTDISPLPKCICKYNMWAVMFQYAKSKKKDTKCRALFEIRIMNNKSLYNNDHNIVRF